jgi:hypothetical protein
MPKVSPETSAESLPRIPDLEITIRLDGTGALLFEVHAPDPESGINMLQLRSEPLPAPPDKYLRYLFKDIEDLSLDTEQDRRAAEKKLGIKGLVIWKLFPRELQGLLWKRRRRALTLLIQSDESYIPWEIAKLQSWGRDRRVVAGPFLCEAFAVTRWVRGNPHQTRLPLRNLALVIPRTSRLPGAAAEGEEIRQLAALHGCQVTDIEPTFDPVCQAMASGIYGGWHFAGHGAAIGDDANRWHIELDGLRHLSAEDLLDETRNLGLSHPLVFLNGCTTGRGGLTLTGPGGWSRSFLEANAGAFIGTYWGIADDKSRELATTFYKNLFKGLPVGEALRKARLRLHKKHKGDPTWLAYTVFAHPLASCGGLPGKAARPERLADRKPPQLAVPVLPWRRDVDSPGALLRAQYGVVPFHRRERELSDLQDWCHDSAAAQVRLYTGPGGMGKTRLALEAALKMREEGWHAGFVTDEAIRSPEKTWKALARPEGKLLLIVDYAEINRPFLIPVLREMYRLERGPVRLLLLARAALGWWEQLKSEREGVGELLSGPATSLHSLQQLADSIAARAASYDIAARAFSERLQTSASVPPDDLGADYFQRVLLLHMKALIDMEGEEKTMGEDGILDRILARERKFWATRTGDHGISLEIAAGIGRAMAVITLGGGAQGEAEALEALRGLLFFKDQPTAALTAVAQLLHECYPGERWIEPLQPDLLGEHLAQRELEQGADELLDLVLGPRSRV